MLELPGARQQGTNRNFGSKYQVFGIRSASSDKSNASVASSRCVGNRKEFRTGEGDCSFDASNRCDSGGELVVGGLSLIHDMG